MSPSRKTLALLTLLISAQVLLGALGARASADDDAPRVAKARAAHEAEVRGWFETAGVAYPAKTLLIRVFKDSDELELWAEHDDGRLRLVQAFPVCARSGELGPKRRQGDLQVPEGIYRVDRFNPWSSYHLSLGVSYPNKSDRIRGRALHTRSLGGDIFIHGDCVTIGCVPIEDAPMETLYLATWDAKRGYGAEARVEVHLFPGRLDDDGLARLIAEHPGDDANHALWRELKPFYDAVERDRRLPAYRIDDAGRYHLRARSVSSSSRSRGRASR